jgi:hypothetical protein
MKAIDTLRHAQRAAARSAGVFLRDVGHGLLEISHNTLALLGLAVVAVAVFAAGRADCGTRSRCTHWNGCRTGTKRDRRAGDVLAALAEPGPSAAPPPSTRRS